METYNLLDFIKRKLSATERGKMLDWLASDKEHRKELFELEQIHSVGEQKRFSDKERMDYAFKLLENKLNLASSKKKQKRHFIFHSVWMRYVAAAVLVLAIVMGGFLYMHEDIVTYNTLIVPTGERATLLLSDGTKVTLNAESRLRYPSSFNKGTRRVELQGEAYFEVAKNDRHPFLVDLKGLGIKVLGTKFNVQAYRGENYWVNLFEGCIKVYTDDQSEKIIMKPNYQLCYTTNHKMIVKQTADATASLAWISGGLKLQEVSLREIANVLERKYGVAIHINSDLAEEPFNCHFDSTITLEEALKLLSKSGKFNYFEKGKNIYLYKKQ